MLFNGCSIKLNKNNPDTDGDGESDATDPTPLRYQLNEELCKKICELNFMSREYIEEYVNLSSDINVKNGHIGKEWYDEWITFMFIRQFNSNYVGGNWDGTAGTIDYQFVEYVKNNDPDLFTFFESNSDYIASENGDMGDLYHLAATMSALIYESTFDDGRLFGLIPEKNIDSLAGWAGDLQTAMNDATIAVGDWADIDAINIKNMISRGDSLCESLNKYFSEGYKKRFTTFVDDKSRDSFIQETYVYTTEYFLGTRINGNIFGYEISSRWPLFEIKFFNKEWSMAASIAFTDYIFERMEDE